VSGDRLRVGVGVEVVVPASSANLGPGFDSVGCALGVWDTCRATVTAEPGLVVTVAGEGEGAVPLDATHLVHRAMQTAWAELGVQPPEGLSLACRNAVPHGRGMGSSATAIVTGIVAAQALHDVSCGRDGGDVDLAFTNSLASRLEGHPDNASASVYGGATLSWSDDGGLSTSTVHLPVHPDVEPVVFAPDAQLSTAKARSVLPQRVRLADAAANSARAALLAHALGAAPEHLLAATREWLHQEARRSSYAESMALVDRLRSAGHAAVISGAGPSVLVLARREALDRVRAHGSEGWRVLTPGIPPSGARVEVLTRG
jgi:homoserine kinase